MSGRGLIPCVIYIIFIIIIFFFFFVSIRSMDFPVIDENTGLRLSAEGGLPIVLQVRVGMALNTYHIKYVIA
jgi:hypothetical protein